MLRQDSLADHVARTGHQRCRVARELRPETDCKVNVTSLAYSSVYGNKIRKLWKLLAKNDLLTSTSYEFANANRCKVKDCDFQVTFINYKRLVWNLPSLSFPGIHSHGDLQAYPRKSFD